MGRGETTIIEQESDEEGKNVALNYSGATICKKPLNDILKQSLPMFVLFGESAVSSKIKLYSNFMRQS